jgi:hypothetical protein
MGILMNKIANRIKLLKFCLLNVCKRVYGIYTVSQLETVRIKGVDLNCKFEQLT